MKKFIASTVVLAMLFTGCSSNDESDSVDASQESVMTPAEKDAFFVDFIKDNTNAFDASPDRDIIALAGSVCDAWEAGVEIEDIASAFSNYNVEDGGYFVGGATEAYCPEYSYKFTS